VGSTSGALSLVMQVADSSTVMIGGLLSLVDDPSDQDQLIPVLGTIPVVGMLFNSVDHEVRISELVIMLTPRILDDIGG